MGKEGWAPSSYLELENDDLVGSLDEVATDIPVTPSKTNTVCLCGFSYSILPPHCADQDAVFDGGFKLAWEEEYYSKEEYVAELEDEVSFPKGVAIEVLKKSLFGWWTVRSVITTCVHSSDIYSLTKLSHWVAF